MLNRVVTVRNVHFHLLWENKNQCPNIKAKTGKWSYHQGLQCTDNECLGEPEKTLTKAEIFIRTAADCGAKLICFPEQFATGWDPKPQKNIQDIHGSIIISLQTYAKEYRIGIIGSFREAHDPLPKNTAIVINRDGRILAKYAKMHLFSMSHEHEGNSPGTDLGIFTFDSLTCGIAICYDLRFPELFRIYAQKGVHAVFVPSAWPQSRIRHWELFIRHGLQKTRCMFWE